MSRSAPRATPVAALAARRLDSEAPSPAAEELIRRHLGLVEQCADLYRERLGAADDLVVVGLRGLREAASRFDPARGVGFPAFATQTILTSMRRHLREYGRSAGNRRKDVLAGQIIPHAEAVDRRLGRSPTPREVADRLGCSVEEVIEGLEIGDGRFRAAPPRVS